MSDETNKKLPSAAERRDMIVEALCICARRFADQATDDGRLVAQLLHKTASEVRVLEGELEAALTRCRVLRDERDELAARNEHHKRELALRVLASRSDGPVIVTTEEVP